MSRPDQSTELKLVVTNTLIVADIQRSVVFYRDVLGTTVLRDGQPTFLRLENIWLTINGSGGSTKDLLVIPVRENQQPLHGIPIDPAGAF